MNTLLVHKGVLCWTIVGILLCCVCYAQQATNGQQVAVGGDRFFELEISGLNQDNQPTTWTNNSGFGNRGTTLAYVEGWWWKGDLNIRARKLSGSWLECTIGPLKVGFPIVIVVIQDERCLGDSSNSSSIARALETWLQKQSSRRRLQALSELLKTAEDAWSCVGALIHESTSVQRGCRGVSQVHIAILAR